MLVPGNEAFGEDRFTFGMNGERVPETFNHIENQELTSNCIIIYMCVPLPDTAPTPPLPKTPFS